jgi:hypothetical protein
MGGFRVHWLLFFCQVWSALTELPAERMNNGYQISESRAEETRDDTEGTSGGEADEGGRRVHSPT